MGEGLGVRSKQTSPLLSPLHSVEGTVRLYDNTADTTDAIMVILSGLTQKLKGLKTLLSVFASLLPRGEGLGMRLFLPPLSLLFMGEGLGVR
jgi:hypothetical protein